MQVWWESLLLLLGLEQTSTCVPVMLHEVWLVWLTPKNGLGCKESFSFHITCRAQWEMEVPPMLKKWGNNTVKDINI